MMVLTEGVQTVDGWDLEILNYVKTKFLLLLLFFLQVLSTSPVLPQSTSPTPNSLLTPISSAYPTILSDGSVGLWQQQWTLTKKSHDFI